MIIERRYVVRAIRFTDFKTMPVLEENVPRPIPGPGQVLLRVAGSGACHSDVAFFHEYDQDPLGGHLTPGFVLGHEVSGWIEEVGEGVHGLAEGDAYLVYGPIGCGHCRACARGEDTYCENFAEVDYMGIGIGLDGGMADYVVVPSNHLVPLGDADPVDAAPLADAGLTPYHAIKTNLPALNGAGKYALVVGLGGLGFLAVQMLKALTGATILVCDTKQSAVDAAVALGAIAVPNDGDQVSAIKALTGGHGVDAAFDFVGITATERLVAHSMAVRGKATVVGIAGKDYPWNWYTSAYESTLANTYWGSIEDLYDVVELYKAGKISTKITHCTFDDILDAYQRLVDGTMEGRAVLVPTATKQPA